MKRIIVEGEAQCALVLRLLKMHAEIKDGEPDGVMAGEIAQAAEVASLLPDEPKPLRELVGDF